MHKPKMTPALRAQMEKAMGKVGFALNQLMSRQKIPMVIGREQKKVTLDPEAYLCVQLADFLRTQTLAYYESGGEHGLKAVWCHCANERQAGWFTLLLLRSMGMLSGAHDYWFVWEGGGGLIEMKAAAGDLLVEQEYFQRWARAFDANTAICRSVESVKDTLVKWGCLVLQHGAADITTKGDNYGQESI